MTPRDMALAACTSIAWGLAFAAVKFGLQSFSATELVAVRFLIAGLPLFVVPRPKMGWTSIVLIGMTLFTGQFLLLFLAYTQGMPPGLASVTQQTQAFFTVLLAAAFLRDIPTPRQITGMIIAFAGLGLIAATAGSDVSWAGLGLALAGALSWAVGNVLVKRSPKVPIFPLVVWCSLVPPLPALLLSSVVDPGRLRFLPALLHASSISIAAALYLGVVATLFGYAVGLSAPPVFRRDRRAVRTDRALRRRRLVGAPLRRSLSAGAIRRYGPHPGRTCGRSWIGRRYAPAAERGRRCGLLAAGARTVVGAGQGRSRKALRPGSR